jgi:hypothetical protein
MVYCAATWCTVLQHVVLRCNMLQQVSLSLSVDGTPHTIRFLDSLELAVMDRAGKLIWWSHIATQHTMLQHSAACCNTAQHSTTVQQSTPWCNKARHGATKHAMVQQSTPRCNKARHGATKHATVQQSTSCRNASRRWRCFNGPDRRGSCGSPTRSPTCGTRHGQARPRLARAHRCCAMHSSARLSGRFGSTWSL